MIVDCEYLRRAALGMTLLALPLPALPARAQPAWTDRLSLMGEGALPPGFTHFPHADPDAPKGCTWRLPFATAFDTLNPYVLVGRPFLGGGGTSGTPVVESLLAENPGEPASAYAHLAEAVRLDEDARLLEIRLDPRARWQDGRPVAAEDVAFTWATLGRHGRPYYLGLLNGVSVEVTGPRELRVTLPPGQVRRRALELSGLPVLPKHAWDGRPFDAPLLDPLPGSGPYRIASIDPGRRVVLERDPGWWARDLPTGRGRFNADRVIHTRYADSGATFEAVSAGLLDEMQETDVLRWREAGALAPFRAGRLRRHELRNWYPVPTSGVTFNLRHPAFADARVRAAMNALFDFAWVDRAITRGEAERSRSLFGNTLFAAEHAPDEAERRLLEPFRATLPPGLWAGSHENPPGAGTGRNRAGREQALALLAEAGWRLRDGVMRNTRDGTPLRFTVLAQSDRVLRVFGHWFANLSRIGITARLQLLDSASFERRRAERDFEAIVLTVIAPAWPGAEQARSWGSGGLAGLDDPAADAMIRAAATAPDLTALTPALRALDRIVAWRQPGVPGVHEAKTRLYLSRSIAVPPVQPRYGHGRDAWFCAPPE
jgi:microcin C transport system substrate-binding protein